MFPFDFRGWYEKSRPLWPTVLVYSSNPTDWCQCEIIRAVVAERERAEPELGSAQCRLPRQHLQHHRRHPCQLRQPWSPIRHRSWERHFAEYPGQGQLPHQTRRQLLGHAVGLSRPDGHRLPSTAHRHQSQPHCAKTSVGRFLARLHELLLGLPPKRRRLQKTTRPA